MRLFLALFLLLLSPQLALAEMAPRDGWSVTQTSKSHDQLVADVKSAAKANKMGVVTQAGPTAAAAKRGITIPGNRVIGLFNNVYAVNILNLSTAAMIEAPIRMYVTENADGTATLSYKLPTTVFAPYMEEAGPELATLANELDAIFAAISDQATR
ncbi:DUF302 domain-containing protein [uncultured Tateyamaria sp.]|uniref:DUF302 domain-containing protein n=1 Tax=uncultured Tateyamaria sp. TaxID=455651 RepID=UPI00262D5930|nr:DUF302 domain-containing protein [uncultured Tateyamaria sp.]